MKGSPTLETENQRLKDIIKRASKKFCEDGSDGAIAASMFSILGEAFMANAEDTHHKPKLQDND